MRRFLILLVSLFLLAAVLFSTGCIQSRIQTTVKEDGSGERILSVTLPKELRSFMAEEPSDPNTPGPYYRDLIFPASQGWSVTEFPEGEKIRFEGRRSFSNISELNSGLSTVELQREKFLFTVKYTYKESLRWDPSRFTKGDFPLDQVESFVKSVRVHSSVDLPGKIIESNGTITDGRFENEFTGAEALGGVILSGGSQQTRWNVVVILIGILLILFVLLLGQILLAVRSNQKEAVVETVDLE